MVGTLCRNCWPSPLSVSWARARESTPEADPHLLSLTCTEQDIVEFVGAVCSRLRNKKHNQRDPFMRFSSDILDFASPLETVLIINKVSVLPHGIDLVSWWINALSSVF